MAINGIKRVLKYSNQLSCALNVYVIDGTALLRLPLHSHAIPIVNLQEKKTYHMEAASNPTSRLSLSEPSWIQFMYYREASELVNCFLGFCSCMISVVDSGAPLIRCRSPSLQVSRKRSPLSTRDLLSIISMHLEFTTRIQVLWKQIRWKGRLVGILAPTNQDNSNRSICDINKRRTLNRRDGCA